MTFYNWLMEFIDVDLPIGDFAKDAKNDSNFPKNVSSWDALADYITSVNPRNAELDVIQNVFNYYAAEYLE